jgi:V8-like Glu-specific endopeptidase
MGRNCYNQLLKGTGFLIASDLVLTVAHNAYSRSDKADSVNMVFYPGATDKLTPDNAYKVIDVRLPSQYRTCPGSESLRYDYALLKLDRRVVREQYIELGLDYVHCQEPLGIFGYRDCGEKTADQKGFWKSNAHQTDLPSIKHRLSTLAGNSGSPLLVKRNNKTLAIAIHKGGKKG